jgi:cobalt-zinc-cadmium resistance protein CzcA
MYWVGLSGNLMSLGAIDFGLLVDGSVVMVENMVRRLAEFSKEHGRSVRAPLRVFSAACQEVARPVVFGVGIILLVYLPVFSLSGIEGKMFRPMAWTVVFGLGTALVLALTLMPVLVSLLLRRGVCEHETLLIRWVKRAYLPSLRWSLARPGTIVCGAVVVFGISVAVARNLGAVFVPKLEEGALAIQAIRLPSVSLEASLRMTGQIEAVLRQFQPVESVISKTGRPEIATDPMTVNLSDIIITLKPRKEWIGYDSKDALIAALQARLQSQTYGNAYSFSQPIELRVRN